MELLFEQVRYIVLVFLQSESSLAAVARDEASASREAVYGQQAAVGTALAASHGCLVGELIHFLGREHGRGIALRIILTGDQSRAEGAHDACDIRSYGLSSGYKLEGAEHGVVVKCTALDHDLFAELLWIGELYNLDESVLYN